VEAVQELACCIFAIPVLGFPFAAAVEGDCHIEDHWSIDSPGAGLYSVQAAVVDSCLELVSSMGSVRVKNEVESAGEFSEQTVG
jgi:hypothetical protein